MTWRYYTAPPTAESARMSLEYRKCNAIPDPTSRENDVAARSELPLEYCALAVFRCSSAVPQGNDNIMPRWYARDVISMEGNVS